jgi:hypothetical protein
MKTCAALAAVLIVSAPAAAEPMLLMDLLRFNTRDVGIYGVVVRMEFAVGPDGSITGRGRIAGNYTPAHVGQEIFASPENLENMKYWLTNEGEYYWNSGHGVFPTIGDVDELWRTDWPPTRQVFTHYVPRLGPGLTGYDVSAVSHTIDSFTYEGGRSIYAVTKTRIRIYGEPLRVPEPASWLLGCLALCVVRRNARY